MVSAVIAMDDGPKRHCGEGAEPDQVRVPRRRVVAPTAAPRLAQPVGGGYFWAGEKLGKERRRKDCKSETKREVALYWSKRKVRPLVVTKLPSQNAARGGTQGGKFGTGPRNHCCCSTRFSLFCFFYTCLCKFRAAKLDKKCISKNKVTA